MTNIQISESNIDYSKTKAACPTSVHISDWRETLHLQSTFLPDLIKCIFFVCFYKLHFVVSMSREDDVRDDLR